LPDDLTGVLGLSRPLNCASTAVRGFEPVFFPRERAALWWLCVVWALVLGWRAWTQPVGFGDAVQPLVLDVNTAPLAELEVLPGVGPVTAAELVRARPFRSEGELIAVLGEDRWRRARPYVQELGQGETPGR
jgi:hypothetical protein